MKRLYIVAGNKQQADYWARQWKIPPKNWVYVSSEIVLRGLRDIEYTIAGTAYYHRNYTEIMDRMKIIQARYVENSVLDSGTWMS